MLYVFFGLSELYYWSAINTIEYINAKKVIDGSSTNWTLIEPQSDIQPRCDTFAAQIDDNEIVILGGGDRNNDLIGEVLLFNTESNQASKVVTESSIEFGSAYNNCDMTRKGQVVAIDKINNRVIQFTKGDTDMRVIQEHFD